MRAVVAQADHILDIHSTSQDVVPFWVYPAFARNARAASALASPAVHLVMPQGLGSGTPVIQHGRHGQADSNAGVAVVVECGQHFKQSTADLAIQVTLDFLGHFGLMDRTVSAAPAPRRFELLSTHVVANADFRFTRPVIGFETFAKGELIAVDGEQPIHAPCDDCTLFMPTREPVVGREGVYLTRPLAN
jgi:predicted deacylase